MVFLFISHYNNRQPVGNRIPFLCHIFKICSTFAPKKEVNFDNGNLYTSLAGEEPVRTVEDAVVFAEEADEVVVEDAIVVEI